MTHPAHTILVAFTVHAPDWLAAQEQLMRQLPNPNHPGVDGIDSWWIAEDVRMDGSDNDSAVFVPLGSQVMWQMEIESDAEAEDE